MRWKEGQSWLEEMYVVTKIMVQIVAMIPSCSKPDANLETAIATLTKAHHVFRELLVSL